MDSYSCYTTQNQLLLKNLMKFYETTYEDSETYNPNNNLDKMLKIITGESKISLRIVDWFATNYAKKYYTLYLLEPTEENNARRFKVYDDYKLKLKAYSKARFDPFCRWDRINIPYTNGNFIETTIGQLNFFKWALENKVIDYIEKNYETIEKDMNSRNSTSKRKESNGDNSKTRKKREELSVSATKSIVKEKVEIIVKFS
jgi:hypothetical protein